MLTKDQQIANELNALLSTGPRSAEGKKTSAMNALRHGLTGRVVVLPSEDMDEFQRFSQLMIESLAPATMAEKELAQTIADSQWRINRMLTIEDGMLGLGQFEVPGYFDTGDHVVNNVLTAAQTFRDHSKSFVNLSIYEQRIHRTMAKAHKQLQELQTARKAERSAQMAEAVRLRNFDQMNGLPFNSAANGFVFSNPEIDLEAGRLIRREHAGIAEKCRFNLARFNARLQNDPGEEEECGRKAA